ncbi:unnamed protein product [Scytosiphon promiscuus]
MSRSQRKCNMKLRTALVLVSLARTSHSFFFSPPLTPTSVPQGPAAEAVAVPPYRTGLYGPGSRCWATQRRRAVAAGAPLMAAGEGMGGGLSGARGAGGRGGKGKGKGKGKKKKKGSKQGTLIPGPPRLETVPEDKLDQAYVFRQERPGQTPRVIECYADRFAVVGGRRYMIGHPCDWAVSVCIPKDEGNVEAVPLDSELMEELLPGLQVELVQLVSPRCFLRASDTGTVVLHVLVKFRDIDESGVSCCILALLSSSEEVGLRSPPLCRCMNVRSAS